MPEQAFFGLPTLWYNVAGGIDCPMQAQRITVYSFGFDTAQQKYRSCFHAIEQNYIDDELQWSAKLQDINKDKDMKTSAQLSPLPQISAGH